MSEPPRTGDEAFAALLGITPASATRYRKQISGQGEAAAGFAETDAAIRARAAMADLEAVRSLDDEDIADFAAEPDPIAALREEVRERADRSLMGQIAAHTSWAETEDPTERTRPGREAFQASFERKVDPEGKLPPAERARRAEHARKAHYLQMSLKSAQVRRERKRAAQERQDLPTRADSDRR